MPKKERTSSVLAQAKAWAIRNKLFGAQAFLRYVIFQFTENLNRVSSDFVFKGGNLLWVYIGTPRATIDLDLSTIHSHSHADVRKLLDKACAASPEIRYSVAVFKEVAQEDKPGAAVTIVYETNDGAKNQFEVDVIYGLDADTHDIESPIHPDCSIISATIENIITDKFLACHRFGSGNSRMKDYDDLWRLAKTPNKLDSKKLSRLLKQRDIPPFLDLRWINTDLKRAWASHQKRYPDLPTDLESLFRDVNTAFAEARPKK